MDLLPALVGIDWRPVTAADAAALTDLYNAWSEHRSIGEVMSVEDTRHELEDPAADPATRSMGGFDGGVAMAWASFSVRPGPADIVAYAQVVVRPGTPDAVEPALIRWVERTATLDVAAAGLPGRIRFLVRDADTTGLETLDAGGFSPSRHWFVMVRPLDLPPPPGASEPEAKAEGEHHPGGLDPAYSIACWDPERAEEVRRCHNDAFAGHWGSRPRTADSWAHDVLGDPGFRPDLSFLATRDDLVAGYLISAVYPQEFAAKGRREGWVWLLGVRPGHRGRGVASALLVTAMEAYRDAGLDHATLSVDSANTTGAGALYERLGFRVDERGTTMEKAVAGP
jgi:mycothiol synthase